MGTKAQKREERVNDLDHRMSKIESALKKKEKKLQGHDK